MGEMLIPSGSPFWRNLTVLRDYTSPVMIVLGEHDYVVCGQSCMIPRNLADDTLSFAYSAADPNRSETWILPGGGHNLNTHLHAGDGFNKMVAWVKNLEWDV
jgi:pimeloyl-ACP methyl ester carboxylesterase